MGRELFTAGIGVNRHLSPPLGVTEPFDWQIVGLWDMWQRIRLIQFQCPIPGARAASGRVVEGGEYLLPPELQRLEFEALRRQLTPTKKPR